jgi:hypothetical protein
MLALRRVSIIALTADGRKNADPPIPRVLDLPGVRFSGVARQWSVTSTTADC